MQTSQQMGAAQSQAPAAPAQQQAQAPKPQQQGSTYRLTDWASI